MVQEKLLIRPYQDEDKKDVIELWHDCKLVVPQNDPELVVPEKVCFER